MEEEIEGDVRLEKINLSVMLFFFLAEDGIRDRTVTGVQTCALPIFGAIHAAFAQPFADRSRIRRTAFTRLFDKFLVPFQFFFNAEVLAVLSAFATARERSEERRVGKE